MCNENNHTRGTHLLDVMRLIRNDPPDELPWSFQMKDGERRSLSVFVLA
jgi:hypothetical protein